MSFVSWLKYMCEIVNYIHWRQNLVQISPDWAHNLRCPHTGSNTMGHEPALNTWEVCSEACTEILSITPQITPTAVWRLRFMALFGLKRMLLVLDLSYINIQPHTLFRFVCVQTHKHTQTHMFREWVKRRSDKAYLIWDYSSLNQVEEILTHLCVQNKKCVSLR